MILFNLKCNQHHIFEVWFKDSQEFEKQNKFSFSYEVPLGGYYIIK